MSKLNHSPGKWESHGTMRIADPEFIKVFPHRTGGSFEIEAITIVVRYGYDDDVLYIASVDGEANARLISAAPDMLDALIAQYNHTKNDHHVNGMNEATKAAIEYATGLPIDEMLRRVNINTVDGPVVVTRIEYDDIGPDINGFRRYRVYYIDARNKRAMKTFHDDQWRERALLVGMGGTND